MAQWVKNIPAVQETWVQSLNQEDPLEEETATHSSILAWEIPWMEEPSGLQSMLLQESQTQLSDSTSMTISTKMPPQLDSSAAVSLYSWRPHSSLPSRDLSSITTGVSKATSQGGDTCYSKKEVSSPDALLCVKNGMHCPSHSYVDS